MVRVITSCYGDKYINAIKKWEQQLNKNNLTDIEIIILYDKNKPTIETNAKIIYEQHDEKSLVWGYGDLIRLKHIIDNLQANYVQIDMDVYINKDIAKIVDLPFDFIISRGRYQPPDVLKKLHFVCCTGFYIVKPNAKQLLCDLYENIINRKYKSELDQVVLNKMLVDEKWEKITVDNFVLDITNYKGIKIAVLDEKTILRGNNQSIESYGYHWKTFIDLFNR